MTNEQIQMRVKWAINELINRGIMQQCDAQYIDLTLFSAKSSKHVLDFVWPLVAYDIMFLCDIYEFLSTSNLQLLTQLSFNVSIGTT